MRLPFNCFFIYLYVLIPATLPSIKNTPRLVSASEQLMTLANGDMKASHPQDALSKYKRVLAICEGSLSKDRHPDYVSCLLNLGECYLTLDDTEKAQSIFALAFEKVFFILYYDYGHGLLTSILA